MGDSFIIKFVIKVTISNISLIIGRRFDFFDSESFRSPIPKTIEKNIIGSMLPLDSELKILVGIILITISNKESGFDNLETSKGSIFELI